MALRSLVIPLRGGIPAELLDVWAGRADLAAQGGRVYEWMRGRASEWANWHDPCLRNQSSQ
eukprot:2249763-Alexandrium_andersonii.AAC.1